MSLIQINQKLLHITITLLIYGVSMESVKCPDVCHCVETSVFYSGNSTKVDAEESDSIRRTDVARKASDASFREEVMIGLNEIEDDSDNKTVKNDIFIRNFSTSGPGESFLVKNSKDFRNNRTSKLGEGSSETNRESDRRRRESAEDGGDDSRESEERKIKEFFTYQITCNEVRDVKALSLRDLPNPTTQLIIQRANFQSVGTFFRIVKECSARLDLLTDLSITNSVMGEGGGGGEVDAEDNETITDESSEIRQKFLPFASLQNPQVRLRNDSGKGEAVSKLLVILNLSNNTLRCLPKDAFRPYQNLQTLDLSNNQIQQLDDEVFSSLTNLLRLDLHSNNISTLNELVFKNLTKLLTLDMSKNSISNIAPSTFQYLTSLNTLILSDNPLSMKQQSMILLGTGKRLQTVDASKTGLKQIPGTLERSVQTLNLQGNYLSSIQCGDLDSYSLLTSLDLGSNKISYVEDDALGRLELLTNLRINENNLFQIPKSLPNNLEILNLSYNNIQNITNSDFLNLSLLKELYISYNQVNNIEENSFDNLSELRVLDLSHNPILILPNMYGLVKLTTLNLSYFTNIPNHFSGRYEEFPAQAPEEIRVLNLESSPLLTRTFLQDTKTLQSFVKLEELYLRFSNLTSLRKDIFSILPKLRVLRVEGNPWHCEREILKLSEWLKSNEAGESSSTASDEEEEDGNEVNTAHCATPPSLHKKPLVSLTAEDFADDGEPSPRYREIEKVISGKALESRQMTIKKIQEIQSKDGIYFKSSEKPIDYGKDGEFEDLSNTSRKNEIDLTGERNESRSGFSDNSEANETRYVISDNGTAEADGDCCSNATTELQEPSTAAGDEGETTESLDETAFWNNKSSTRSESPTTESHAEVTKAEAMPVKDTSSSDLKQNAHPRLMLVTFVGAVMLATTAVTILHFAKSRKDRSYERQTHDIEVHSISSIGNELW